MLDINKNYTYEEWYNIAGIVFGGYYNAFEPKIKYCDSAYKRWIKGGLELRKTIAEMHPLMLAALPTPILIKRNNER